MRLVKDPSTVSPIEAFYGVLQHAENIVLDASEALPEDEQVCLTDALTDFLGYMEDVRAKVLATGMKFGLLEWKQEKAKPTRGAA